MLTSICRATLDRHLKTATALLKKRESGWRLGMPTQQAYRLEQRLFPSITLLSHHAEHYLVEQWPEKPWAVKSALIALLSSAKLPVFQLGLEKLNDCVGEDEDDFFVSALWLANPIDLTPAQLQALVNSSCAQTLTDTQLARCPWSAETIRKLALPLELPLPYWLPQTQDLKHARSDSILRALITGQPTGPKDLIQQLTNEPTTSMSWQWLTLTNEPNATRLFFMHTESEPNHLQAAELNGTSTYFDALCTSLEKANQVDHAAAALATLTGQALVWQPILTDADTGQAAKRAPQRPIPPQHRPPQGATWLLGQTKSATVLTHWLLNQPSNKQTLGWHHLSQSLGQTLPALSYHWAHTQWRTLRPIVGAERGDHAA